MVLARLVPFEGQSPRVAPDAFRAPSAWLIGDVEGGSEASIWFGCVLRGAVNFVRIGDRSNLQDGCIVHVTGKGLPTRIGVEVTVGHRCILHACSLEDRSFIGMGATLMDGAVVESGAMLAAGSLLTPGKRVPAGQLGAGRPARYVREVSAQESAGFAQASVRYIELARTYRASL